MICAWTFACLALADGAIQLAFPMPRDNRQAPSALQRYFFYGTSTRGKLDYLLGPTDDRSAQIVEAGWIDKECTAAKSPVPGTTGVAIYGMSFSNQVAEQLRAMDPGLSITTFAGPGAPPNHSLACYQARRRKGVDGNQFQIIGVLASAVPRLLTLGGLTTSFEGPMPFTYPRFRLASGALAKEEPIVRSSADLRDPAKWDRYLGQLTADDRFYDDWNMNAAWADRSMFLKLLRRAHAQSAMHDRTAALVNVGGSFRPDSEVAIVLTAILVEFARAVKADGQRPLVILFQDRDTGVDSLDRLVGPALEREGVTVINSADVAPNTDPRNFTADGHFTLAVDRRIAALTLAQMRAANISR